MGSSRPVRPSRQSRSIGNNEIRGLAQAGSGIIRSRGAISLSILLAIGTIVVLFWDVRAPALPARGVLSPEVRAGLPMATSARSDRELVESWIASLGSEVTRRNFGVTAERFLEELKVPLRQATVEEVRAALERIAAGAADSSGRCRRLWRWASCWRRAFPTGRSSATIKMRRWAAGERA